ncbi:MAG: transcription termination factor NusA [Gemmataceae bacterium]|nr:transcription termination factor NusA [Gemmataceae bacterium]
MKGNDVLRIVDQMHHEKNIDREIIFSGIEAALQLASEKKFGEESGVVVKIDRDTGDLHVRRGEEDIDPALLGRISAQSAKQVMIQKIREAECNAVYEEYVGQKGDLVTGPIVRHEGGAGIVTLGKTEAILPRSEQIPGESHHVGERVKAVVLDVKKAGTRVKIILSRTHPEFVRRLFENEIPEIQDRTIEIRAVAREAGYRCKIAVSSIDLKVDCVGACVGVRGSRIKNVVDELGGERIDIVRWNDSLQVMIPNALQPAGVDEVFLYGRLGRAIVLVKEDQLSLAIGRRGQNVRLASKLVGWDIEIMTIDELNESVERADRWFKGIPGMPDEAVERYIEEGFLSFDDLTFIEPAEMAEMTGLDEDTCAGVIEYAEEMALKIERFGDPGARRGGRGAAAQGEAAADGEATEEGETGAEGEAPAEGVEGETPADGETPVEETTGDMAVEHADTSADGEAAAEEQKDQEGHGTPQITESA